MSKFYIVWTCPECDHETKDLVEDLSNDTPEVSWNFTEQSSFVCEGCKEEFGTGDYELFSPKDL